jgi:hypothetical protein
MPPPIIDESLRCMAFGVNRDPQVWRGLCAVCMTGGVFAHRGQVYGKQSVWRPFTLAACAGYNANRLQIVSDKSCATLHHAAA